MSPWSASCDMVRYATGGSASLANWSAGGGGIEGQSLTQDNSQRFRATWVTLIDVAYINSPCLCPGVLEACRGERGVGGCHGGRRELVRGVAQSRPANLQVGWQMVSAPSLGRQEGIVRERQSRWIK